MIRVCKGDLGCTWVRVMSWWLKNFLLNYVAEWNKVHRVAVLHHLRQSPGPILHFYLSQYHIIFTRLQRPDTLSHTARRRRMTSGSPLGVLHCTSNVYYYISLAAVCNKHPLRSHNIYNNMFIIHIIQLPMIIYFI